MKHGSAAESADGCDNTLDRASIQRSMSTNTSAGLQDSGTIAIESNAQTLGDSIKSATLGLDGEGYEHHYVRDADAVVVIDGRDVDHVQWLAGRPLSEWEQYVDEERGWISMGQLASAVLEADARRKGAEQ